MYSRKELWDFSHSSFIFENFKIESILSIINIYLFMLSGIVQRRIYLVIEIYNDVYVKYVYLVVKKILY